MLRIHHFAVAVAAASSLSAQVIAEREANDSAASANSVRCARPIYGTIAPAGDADFFRFILASDADVLIDTTSRDGASRSPFALGPPSIDDTTLTLYDGAATPIEFDDDGGEGLFSRLSASLTAGTYYVAVRGFGSTEGDYALYVACRPPAPALPPACAGFTLAAGENEPNDTCATATPSACCDEHVNTCQIAGDVDYYAITLTDWSRVTWETHASTAVSGSALGDSRIWLYDASCSLLASDDDGGAGLYSRLQADLAPGTYVLEVSHWMRAGPGDYRLTIDCIAPIPPALPSGFAYDGVACAGSGGTLTTAMPINGLAIIGSILRIELFGSSGGPAVALIGTPLGPLDLTPVGAPGCFLAVADYGAPIVGTPTGPGLQELTLPLPYDITLIGTLFAQQWLELDPAANALGLTSSDRATILIGTE